MLCKTDTSNCEKKQRSQRPKEAKDNIIKIPDKISPILWVHQTRERERVRACLHGGGGPRVGEVTRPAVVEK